MTKKSVSETEFFKNFAAENPISNPDLIKKFYDCFARNDADGMISCYHDEIEFTDPAFGTLKGAEAKNMWRMLIENGKGNIKIDYKNVTAGTKRGAADWIAEYVFSKTGRKVINKIDSFNVWKWSKQALGISGLLLGWTPFMKNKIRQNALAALRKYSESK
jgi:ketosteroid isomerase-like protein